MRRIAASLFATFILIAPAFAAPPRAAELETTAGIIKWLNAYRFRPDPDGLPVVVRALSRSQAFKDPETSGAYIGFIAGVLSANPTRAGELIASMLPISPADHWVLVRAIAYSDLPDWKELLATFVDRMPTRRVMIDRYLDGKLPTLSQIAYTKKKDGMLDKLKDEFSSDKDRKKPVAIEPSPELVDLLWGYYLATGCYAPIARIIKLLPGANDKDNVDRLTVGSAAKFTLASNAVRDTELLAMLKWSVKHQPKEVASVLKDVIETAETVDSARMRKEALAAIEDLKLKGSESDAKSVNAGTDRPGRSVARLRRSGGDRTRRVRHPMRNRRRGDHGGSVLPRALRRRLRKLRIERSRRVLGLDPLPVRQLVAEPGRLPLGVLPRVALAALGRLCERELAAKIADQPRHAVRLHGRQLRIEIARRERTHLLDRAV